MSPAARLRSATIWRSRRVASVSNFQHHGVGHFGAWFRGFPGRNGRKRSRHCPAAVPRSAHAPGLDAAPGARRTDCGCRLQTRIAYHSRRCRSLGADSDERSRTSDHRHIPPAPRWKERRQQTAPVLLACSRLLPDLPQAPPYAADETPTVRIMINFRSRVCSASAIKCGTLGTTITFRGAMHRTKVTSDRIVPCRLPSRRHLQRQRIGNFCNAAGKLFTAPIGAPPATRRTPVARRAFGPHPCSPQKL